MNVSTARTHIQVIAWINIVLGIPGVLLGLGIAVGAVAFLSGLVPVAVAAFLPIIGLLIAVMSGFGVFVGMGLLQYAPWARIAAIVMSIFHLFGAHTFGFSTLFGIYSLVMLFHPETEYLFHSGGGSGGGVRRLGP